MSTSRSILFFAEEKTEMVEFIHKSIREIHQELYPDFPPHIIKLGQYKNMKPVEMYGSMSIFPEGEDLTYFGGEDVFGNIILSISFGLIWVGQIQHIRIWILVKNQPIQYIILDF